MANGGVEGKPFLKQRLSPNRTNISEFHHQLSFSTHVHDHIILITFVQPTPTARGTRLQRPCEWDLKLRTGSCSSAGGTLQLLT